MPNQPMLIQSLEKLLGEEWYKLEPETIQIKIGELTPSEENAIEALRTLYASNLPWEDPFVFENIVDALNDNPVNPDIVTKPDIDEIMYGVVCMNEIKPEMTFSDDVLAFIAAIAMHDGFVWLPDELSSAQKFMKSHELQLGFKGYETESEAFDIQKKKLLDAKVSLVLKLGQSL